MLGNRNKILQYLRRNIFSNDFQENKVNALDSAAAANGNDY